MSPLTEDARVVLVGSGEAGGGVVKDPTPLESVRGVCLVAVTQP